MKKIISLLITTALMAIIFVGCGRSQNNTSGDINEDNRNQATTEEQTTGSDLAESAGSYLDTEACQFTDKDLKLLDAYNAGEVTFYTAEQFAKDNDMEFYKIGEESICKADYCFVGDACFVCTVDGTSLDEKTGVLVYDPLFMILFDTIYDYIDEQSYSDASDEKINEYITTWAVLTKEERIALAEETATNGEVSDNGKDFFTGFDFWD